MNKKLYYINLLDRLLLLFTHRSILCQQCHDSRSPSRVQVVIINLVKLTTESSANISVPLSDNCTNVQCVSSIKYDPNLNKILFIIFTKLLSPFVYIHLTAHGTMEREAKNQFSVKYINKPASCTCVYFWSSIKTGML